ncbi:calcium/sodium antiporter [Phaeodactylibacter luteus]|uniref:Calcium/sodium antiporter n=1 Tax=Phaeodactylibacter luteus TaxID=1564516 RepID=A0A5C6S110_9BACT|nr:calcium/sodium antiporter [Phaeodactylibacter luteus]TXB67560.1 calcium/sodium antiporter [Phaeodactylibacter luteus]
MDIALYTGLFILSLTVLLKASDWFIDAAEQIGLSLGVSPFIIGVTIVAFGTSLPELATSIASVIGGESEIVVGNVVGSNITNIALVLGLAALVVNRIEMEYNIWHVDMPFLWGSAFLLWFTLRDFHFSIFESLLFLVGIVVFLAYSFKGEDAEEALDRPTINWKVYAMLLLGGVLVYLGADYTIFAIRQLSAMAGINPEIIALSAVALGTSLPEVIVSLNAARRGKASIAVGNVLGSNIFNTYIVMSIPSFFGELTIPANINDVYLPLMIAMTVLFGIMSNNKKITRWEGVVLLMFYAFFFVDLLSTAL